MENMAHYTNVERIFEEMADLLGDAVDRERLIDDGQLSLDGVRMQILPHGIPEDWQFLVYVDFGELPTEDPNNPDGANKFLRRLLNINYISFACDEAERSGRSFCLSDQGNRVLGILRIPIDDRTKGAAVIKLLREEAAAALNRPADKTDAADPRATNDNSTR